MNKLLSTNNIESCVKQSNFILKLLFVTLLKEKCLCIFLSRISSFCIPPLSFQIQSQIFIHLEYTFFFFFCLDPKKGYLYGQAGR